MHFFQRLNVLSWNAASGLVSCLWPFVGTLPCLIAAANTSCSCRGALCATQQGCTGCISLPIHHSYVSLAHLSQLTRPDGRPVYRQLPAGMALVTLQRSPTPSAASSASTATTTAGEVSLGGGRTERQDPEQKGRVDAPRSWFKVRGCARCCRRTGPLHISAVTTSHASERVHGS